MGMCFSSSGTSVGSTQLYRSDTATALKREVEEISVAPPSEIEQHVEPGRVQKVFKPHIHIPTWKIDSHLSSEEVSPTQILRTIKKPKNKIHSISIVSDTSDIKYDAPFSRNHFLEALFEKSGDGWISGMQPRRSQQINISDKSGPIDTTLEETDSQSSEPTESSFTVETIEPEPSITDINESFEIEIVSKLNIINPSDTYLQNVEPMEMYIKLDQFKLGYQNESFAEYGWFDQRADKKLYKRYVVCKGPRYRYLVILFKEQAKYHENKNKELPEISSTNPLNQLFRKDNPFR